jgi:hypothetical protein
MLLGLEVMVMKPQRSSSARQPKIQEARMYNSLFMALLLFAGHNVLK